MSGRVSRSMIRRFCSMSTEVFSQTTVPCFFMKSILLKKQGVPPPQEMMNDGRLVTNSSNTSFSAYRKYSSPFAAKRSEMDFPSFCVMTVSRSKKGNWSLSASSLPQCVLPEPIKPIRKILINRFDLQISDPTSIDQQDQPLLCIYLNAF